MNPIGLPALFFLVFFGLIVPLGALRARRQVARLAELPRLRYLRTVLVQQVLFGTLALLVARAMGIPFRVGRLEPTTIGVTLAALAGAILLMRPRWRKAVERGDPRIALLAPRTGPERAWWVAVSVAAGVSEELVWRWMFVINAAWLVGNWYWAVAIAALLFGVAHAMQGWKNAVLIGVMAVGLSALVQWSEGLLLAMAIHAGYDIVAGWSYGRLMAQRNAAGPDSGN